MMPTSSLHTPQPASSERGAIVIIILIILGALSFLAAELSKETLTDYASSTYFKSTVAGYALCDSGRTIAGQVLKKDYENSKADHHFEEWGKFDEILQEISEEFESGTLSGTIRDENSLFPINKITSSYSTNGMVGNNEAAYREILLRLLTQLCDDLNIKNAKPLDYLNAIRIWQGENLPDAFKHDIWYQSRKSPYARPKQKLVSPEELLFLYWPNAHPDDLTRIYYGTKDIKGLRDLITVWGNGPINMNTAANEILWAIPPKNSNRAVFLQAIITYRDNEENNFAKAWYIPLAKHIGLAQHQIPTNALGTASDIFRVSITTTAGGSEQRECCVLNRTSEGVSILSCFTK